MLDFIDVPLSGPQLYILSPFLVKLVHQCLTLYYMFEHLFIYFFNLHIP